MILEVCKKDDPYLKQHYHNSPLEMVKAGDCLEWTPARIKHAFNFGNGTEKDLKKYIELNKRFSAFYDTAKSAFI